MTDDHAALLSAFRARDRRFDGVVFMGVTSTGIYCRPVCPARPPKAAHCRFFRSAEAAEEASFRPCLRCRPELAPGTAPVDGAQQVSTLVAHHINEGMLDGDAGLAPLARRFGWSPRQLRRIVRAELGVPPMELLMTRRLLLAKQLLTDTTIPVTEVAFASGFRSVRRFNDAFLGRYGMPPSRLRRRVRQDAGAPPASAHRLTLGYRPPFDWTSLLAFLSARAMAGVEHVAAGQWARTVALGGHTGWVRVADDRERARVAVDVSDSLTPVLPALLGRLRNLFDLAARPHVINAHLSRDALLAPLVRAAPGLRVPGAFDGFEMALRAILGQQVAVRAATTIAGRVAERFGAALPSPIHGLTRLTPTAERLADATVPDLRAVGLTGSRAATVIAVARAVSEGAVRLEPGAPLEPTVEALLALPGIGPWTAQYLAMRALRWPDAFPREDLVVRRRLGGLSPAAAARRSAAWSPWRSYAVLHLWRG